jgi:ketosteroid isomerase-like protein
VSTDVEQHIKANEERLRLAMLASDVAVLDELISSDLIFTNHVGQVFSKQDDLGLHRSGVLTFHTLEPSELHVSPCGPLFVVSIRMNMSGVYGGSPFAADLRYTRIWRCLGDGHWQIAVGHSSAIV